MKWIFSLFFLLFSFSFFSQQRSIHLTLSKGKTYIHAIESQSEIFQKSKGKTSKYTLEISAKISYKVKSIKQGNYHLETQYQQMMISVKTSDGNETRFNSDQPSKDVMSNFFYELCRTPFYITMTPYGEILEVDGISKVIENGVKNLNLPQVKIDEIKEKISESYGENAFKGSFEIISLIYPKTLVSMNEPWSTQTKLYSKQFNAQMNNTYRWTSEDDQELTFIGEADFTPIQGGQRENDLPVNGSSNISVKLDKDTGWIRKVHVTQVVRVGDKEGDEYSFTKSKTTYVNQ
ncbi:MAG: DUF6263 family protein [Flavobacteriales bacterium]